MKTHQVIDLHYLPCEGNVDFIGSLEECIEYSSKQSPYFMYKVEPLTKEEIEAYNIPRPFNDN